MKSWGTTPIRVRSPRQFAIDSNSNRSDAIDSDHSLDAREFFRLSHGPWPRTRTIQPFFKFSCSNGSTAPGTWPDITSCRSNRRSSRIWRLCGVGVASAARGVERIDLHPSRRVAQIELAQWLDRKRLRRIPAPGLKRRRPTSRCRHVPRCVGAGCARQSSYRFIMPRVNRFCRDTTLIGIRRGVPTPIGAKGRRNCCLEGVSSWRRFTTWRKVNSSASPTSPPASYDRLSIRLAKPESDPVGLADRIIFCVVKVRVSWLPSWRAATHRGQRPNAERMVSGVLRVRVDLGLRLEDEPHLT